MSINRALELEMIKGDQSCADRKHQHSDRTTALADASELCKHAGWQKVARPASQSVKQTVLPQKLTEQA